MKKDSFQSGNQLMLSVLACLDGGSSSPLALSGQLEQHYGLHIGPRALLAALAQLQSCGWIESYVQEDGDMHYLLTAEGSHALQQQWSSMQQRHERIGLPGVRNFKEKRMRYGRWVRLLLRCYPAAWRERYEQEMLALLEQHTITALTLLDLWFGTWDAHLRAFRSQLSDFKDLRATSMLFITMATLFFFALALRYDMIPVITGNGGFVGMMIGREGSFSPVLELWNLLRTITGNYTIDLWALSSLDNVSRIIELWPLLLCTLLALGMQVKETPRAQRKHLLWPAALGLITLPALPWLYTLLANANSVRLEPQYISSLYPYACLLAISLFVMIVAARKLLSERRKGSLLSGGLLLVGVLVVYQSWQAWQMSTKFFGPQDLWSVVGILPYIASPVALLLAAASTKGFRQRPGILLFPASALSVVMVVMLLISLSNDLENSLMLPKMEVEVVTMGLSNLMTTLIMAVATVLAVWTLIQGFRLLRMPRTPQVPRMEQEMTQVQR